MSDQETMPKRARISVDEAALAAFCERHHIRRLALFGSVLRDDFRIDSDVDVLVEFEPDHVPGFSFVTIQDQLTELLGRRVDLHTAASLSRHFRDDVLRQAELHYVAAAPA
jgi:predicted nucleotidyltransferase